MMIYYIRKVDDNTIYPHAENNSVCRRGGGGAFLAHAKAKNQLNIHKKLITVLELLTRTFYGDLFRSYVRCYYQRVVNEVSNVHPGFPSFQHIM